MGRGPGPGAHSSVRERRMCRGSPHRRGVKLLLGLKGRAECAQWRGAGGARYEGGVLALCAKI